MRSMSKAEAITERASNSARFYMGGERRNNERAGAPTWFALSSPINLFLKLKTPESLFC